MKIFFGFLFIFPTVALATSTILGKQARTLTDQCELSAKFLGSKGKKLTGGPGKASNSENAVYWQLEPVDSIGSKCPKTRALSLRVRSADFSGPISEPKFTYPIDIAEPKLDEIVRLKVTYLNGKDTFLNLKFSEWTFVERLND